MNHYELGKSGGEEAIARNAAEFEADEIERLERICRPPKPAPINRYAHLRLIPTLPDCTFYKKPEPPDDEPNSDALAA